MEFALALSSPWQCRAAPFNAGPSSFNDDRLLKVPIARCENYRASTFQYVSESADIKWDDIAISLIPTGFLYAAKSLENELRDLRKVPADNYNHGPQMVFMETRLL